MSDRGVRPAWPAGVAGAIRVGCAATIPLMVFGGTACTASVEDSSMPEEPAAQVADYRIIFSSERNGNFDLYRMNSDGSDLSRLTDNPAEDWLPYCSPDGSQIVFSSDRDGLHQLYMMPVDGGEATRLTHTDYANNSPSWSPDGSEIAFSSGGNTAVSNLFAIRPDGTNLRQITDMPGYNFLSPTWSPDGSRLAAEGGKLGETIATEWGVAGRTQIWTFASDGSDPIRLTSLDAYNGYPAWSPTGATIVFDSTLEGWADVMAVNVDDGSIANLTQDPRENEFAAWSPDGQQIAFVAGRDGNNEIYVMNADGTNPTRLTNHAAADSAPAWCRR
jgi:TolB protein